MRIVLPCIPRDRTVRPDRGPAVWRTHCAPLQWKVTVWRRILLFLWSGQLGDAGRENVKYLFCSSPLSVGWQWPCFSLTAKSSHHFFHTCFFLLPLPRNCAVPTVLLLLALACAAVLWESPPHPWPYTDLVTNSPCHIFPRPSTGAYHLLSVGCTR